MLVETNKRKMEEEEEEQKEETDAVRKKRKINPVEYQDNLVVFHEEQEVHNNIDTIIDARIESILKKLGLNWMLMQFITIPRDELLKEIKKTVMCGVHDPLKLLIKKMPAPVEKLLDLNSSLDKDKCITHEIDRLLLEKENIQFQKMVNQLRFIRYNILKMIIETLTNSNIWQKTSINPIRSLKKPALITICQEIYTSIIPFASDFSRFFVDDEDGFYDDLNSILGD